MQRTNPTPSRPGAGSGDDHSEARERIEQAGRDAARSVGDDARSRLEHGTSAAARTAEQAGDALDRVAGELSAEGQESLAAAASAMSSRLSGLADYVESRSIEDLTREARHLARSNPGLLIAGGVALGLAMSRFFKASARHPAGAGYSGYADAESETGRRMSGPAGASGAGERAAGGLPRPSGDGRHGSSPPPYSAHEHTTGGRHG